MRVTITVIQPLVCCYAAFDNDDNHDNDDDDEFVNILLKLVGGVCKGVWCGLVGEWKGGLMAADVGCYEGNLKKPNDYKHRSIMIYH